MPTRPSSPNRYTCTIEVPGSATPITWTETVGRRAQIDTRRETRKHGIGAKGTVRVQQRGSVRWKILYQCVVQRDGRLSRRGVEL
jgi:hypothetical protein